MKEQMDLLELVHSGNALDNKHLPYGFVSQSGIPYEDVFLLSFLAATLPIIPYGSLLL